MQFGAALTEGNEGDPGDSAFVSCARPVTMAANSVPDLVTRMTRGRLFCQDVVRIFHHYSFDSTFEMCICTLPQSCNFEHQADIKRRIWPDSSKDAVRIL